MQSITTRCFYGSNLKTLQQNFRENIAGLTNSTENSNISPVEQVVQKSKCIEKTYANTRYGKRDLKKIKFDADGFKVPQQEAPNSTTVQNFREVRSYIVRRAELIRLLEQNPRITSLRLPKLPSHLRNTKIKEWVNFKKHQAAHKSCHSISYVNGCTRIRIAANHQIDIQSYLRREADNRSIVPAYQRSNCSNPSVSAFESNDLSDAPTQASKRFCFREDAIGTPSSSYYPKSKEWISKSHGKQTNESLEEVCPKDLVDEPASYGLEMIRQNYEESTKSQVNEQNDLINVDHHDSTTIGACEDHYNLPKVRTFDRSYLDSIGKLNHCFVSLKRIDQSRNRSSPLEHGLQRNRKIIPCSAILDPLLMDARSSRYNNKVSFPKDKTNHYGTKCKFQEHGNALENSLKPCYVKLKRLDSWLASDSGIKLPLTVEKSPTVPYGMTAVKECFVKLHRMEVKCPNKSRTTTCVMLPRVHRSSKMCYQNQKGQEFGKQLDWTVWEPDLKRCSVLMERLE
ncbi:hypothetical protein LOTGIDRAFT_169602 [Lottia gigantea]|uniref:Uncharacterized protein n=1 Tax=Lottia gigantea TaxID=225164 RepID=V3YYH2_LOTGI|nr:hypothetical protein LOTGIDRAFT_169602 [Lottia gigantea]ESO83193.1 hypothetical protein LOTGIDRAFT_169602 [Lottia gigantea]